MNRIFQAIIFLSLWGTYLSPAQTVIIASPKINKDSLLQLTISRTRIITRAEIGFGFTHFDLSGTEWHKDFFSGNKDTVNYTSKTNPFSFGFGYAFPVKKYNTTTALGANISMLMAVGSNMSLSVPIFMTFRKGGDATIYDHHKKLGFSFGLGAQPGWYYFSGGNHTMFGSTYLRPAYLAELNFTPKVGFFKLRCIGNFWPFKGEKPFEDRLSSNFYGTYKLRGTMTFLLVFTPFWSIQKHITRAINAIPSQ